MCQVNQDAEPRIAQERVAQEANDVGDETQVDAGHMTDAIDDVAGNGKHGHLDDAGGREADTEESLRRAQLLQMPKEEGFVDAKITPENKHHNEKSHNFEILH